MARRRENLLREDIKRQHLRRELNRLRRRQQAFDNRLLRAARRREPQHGSETPPPSSVFQRDAIFGEQPFGLAGTRPPGEQCEVCCHATDCRGRAAKLGR